MRHRRRVTRATDQISVNPTEEHIDMCKQKDSAEPSDKATEKRRGFLKAGAVAGAAVAASAIPATQSQAAVSDYADPEEPALPPSEMSLELSRTALVIIDPQVDFLSPDGVTWGVVGESGVAGRHVSKSVRGKPFSRTTRARL